MCSARHSELSIGLKYIVLRVPKIRHMHGRNRLQDVDLVITVQWRTRTMTLPIWNCLQCSKRQRTS